MSGVCGMCMGSVCGESVGSVGSVWECVECEWSVQGVCGECVGSVRGV